MTEYRSRFATLYDRADLYVPFIEKSLQHLAEAAPWALSAPTAG